MNGRGRFPGVMGFFEYLEQKKYKMHVRIFLSRYRGYAKCLACHGDRLRQEARDVRIGGKSITEVTRMTIAQAAGFFAGPQPFRSAGFYRRKNSGRNPPPAGSAGPGRLGLHRAGSPLFLTIRRRIAEDSTGNLPGIHPGRARCMSSTSRASACTRRDSRRLVEILQSLKSLWATRSWWLSTIRKSCDPRIT